MKEKTSPHPDDRNANPLLLTATKAAEQLGISERHFYKLHASGRVPRPIRLGRAVRWRADELRNWLEASAPARAKWEAIRKRNSR